MERCATPQFSDRGRQASSTEAFLYVSGNIIYSSYLDLSWSFVPNLCSHEHDSYGYSYGDSYGLFVSYLTYFTHVFTQSEFG